MFRTHSLVGARAGQRRIVLVAALAVAGALVVPSVAAATVFTPTFSGGTLTVPGSTGNDTLTVTAPGSGSATVAGAGGDTFTDPDAGGPCTGGATVTCPGATTVNVNGDLGNDTLTGPPPGGTVVTLDGGPGNDQITGPGTGGANDDTLTAPPNGFVSYGWEPGNDTYQKGTGFLNVTYAGAPSGVNVTLDGTANDGIAGEQDNVPATISSLTGSPFNDTLTASDTTAGFIIGGAGNDTITGGAKADDLSGGAGNDTIAGKGGDDSLSGDDGTDRLDGGDGDDSLSYGGTSTAGTGDDYVGGPGEDSITMNPTASTAPFTPFDVSVSVDDQANDGTSGENDNVHTDIENVTTGDGNDTIVGSPGPETLSAGNGNDTVTGNGGVDRLVGGGGNDTLNATDAKADDSLNCGENADGSVDSDTANADEGDAVNANCENVIRTALPVTAAPTVDKTPAKVTIAGVKSSVTRKALRKGLKVGLGSSEPATATVELLAAVRPSGSRLVFTAAVGDVTLRTMKASLGTTAKSVTLKPATKYARAVRNRRLRLTIKVTATDAAGNVSVATKKVRVT